MNLVMIASKSIRQRLLTSSLTAISVALGVMLMVAVLVIHGVLERVFSQRSIGYDLIVGPKGSDLQLVLNTVYRVWQPIENLPYLYYLQLKNHRWVEHAVPFALGDVTQQGSFPIVGTTEKYFELDYTPGKQFLLKGHGFRKSFDAIIGSRVARENNWDLGSKLKLVHGGMDDHVHDEQFTVTGILAATGTPNDKTVFIHLNGFYAIAGHDKPPAEALVQLKMFFPDDPRIQKMQLSDIQSEDPGGHDHDDHQHHAIPDELKEVTAVLLILKLAPDAQPGDPPQTAGRFISELKKGIQAQAVNPIVPMKRLMDLFVGNVRIVLVFLTGLIIAVSGVGIFVSIYNSMADRKREIAIMRALGASRQTVFSIILAESILLCFTGGVFGLILGHGLVFVAAPIVESKSGILINPFAFETMELVLLPLLIVLASLVGFVPGMTAFRTDVAKSLSD